MTDTAAEPPIFGGSKTADSGEKRVRIQENPDQNQEARLAQELLNSPDQDDTATSRPINPKPKRRVSFSDVVKAGEDDSSSKWFCIGVPNPSDWVSESNPCHNDKKLQIISFVSLLMLILIAIAVLVESQQAVEIPTELITGFPELEFTKRELQGHGIFSKSFEINCTFSGNPKPKVQWRLDGYHLPKSLTFDIDDSKFDKYTTEANQEIYNVTSKLKVENVDEKYGGIYTCRSGEQQNSKRIKVHGKPTPREPTEVKSTQGYSVTLYCPMGGWPLENPVWKKDGIDCEKCRTSKPTLYFPSIELSDKGNYSCTMSNELGNATADLYLDVNNNDIVEAGFVQSEDEKVNGGFKILSAGADSLTGQAARKNEFCTGELVMQKPWKWRKFKKESEKTWWMWPQRRKKPVKKVSVQGTCCWEIQNYKNGKYEKFAPGDINRKLTWTSGHIKKLGAYEC